MAKSKNNPRVSVIVTAHNYGRYLDQAIESVLRQTYRDFELIVVDDGSTDDTPKILQRYRKKPNVRCLRRGGIGLARAANAGIRASRGRYVIRLDADDYFDENVLLVLATVLDRRPDIGMVYPDYYQVTKYGEVIDLVRQPKVNDEVHLLDRSALAAGALYRRRCFDALGGYNEVLTHQEDYDFWIRFVDRFRVYNVQLPLMYYRRHSASMSTNTDKRVAARRYVKQSFATVRRALESKKILCVLPMVAENRYRTQLPLHRLGKRALFTYALDEARKIRNIDRIIVDTEHAKIAAAARQCGVEVPFLRPQRLAKLSVSTTDVLRHMLETLANADGYAPDIIVMLSYNSPFVSAAHMEEALHTLLVHDCDSVIGVGTNIKFHWQPGPHGLQPVLYPRKLITDRKWTTYEERGGLFVLRSSNLLTDNFLGKRTSFVEIDEAEGVRIDSDYHLWLAEQLLKQRRLPAPGKRVS